MIDLDKLAGEFRAAGYKSIKDAGRALGIPSATMYRKMQTGSFTFPEVDEMIKVFCIRYPEEIFVLGRRKNYELDQRCIQRSSEGSD